MAKSRKASFKISSKRSAELWNSKLYPNLTPEIIQRFDNFLEFVQPNDFRENIIEIYHSYILNEYNSLPYDFKELSGSIQIFIDFLKFADHELRERAESRYLKKEPPKRQL